MENVRFRASGIGNLISKRPPAGGGLSETAKRFVEQMWLENKYGYREVLRNKYLSKGINMEEDSINLFSEVTGNFYLKNTERKDNGVITGECDMYNDTHIVDVKSSWSLKTFFQSDLSDIYEWQLRAYMELWNKDEAILAYCLLDATEDMIINEQQKSFYYYNNINSEFHSDPIMLAAYEKEVEQIKRNLIVSDRIQKDQRVKQFHIERDDSKTTLMYEQLAKAVKYYESLKL